MSPRRACRETHDAGSVLMFVLLALMLIAAITLSVMRLIAAEIGGSIRDLQSGQVFNIGQAGVHYAIGKLQLSGASTYAGETITLTSGESTLGTAKIIVNCADTGTAPPCAGPYAGYRRIVSTGTLPWSGPTRTIVAVVQATTGGPRGICAYGGVEIGGPATVYGDVGSNGWIALGGAPLRAQLSADPNVPQQFQGTAVAMGRIACGSSCATQVPGKLLPEQPTAVCPVVVSRTYTSGNSNLYVGGAGFTINGATGYAWRDVRIARGSCSGPAPFTDLNLQADPTDPNATTVVQVNTLIMGSCSRVVILGAGRVELRVAEPGRTSLIGLRNSRFAVLPTDTASTPAPVPAKRLLTWVNSSGSGGAVAAVQFDNAQLVAGTILAPNGKAVFSGVTTTTGAVLANAVSFNAGGTFVSDVSGLPPGASVPYANFMQLRSWKDQ